LTEVLERPETIETEPVTEQPVEPVAEVLAATEAPEQAGPVLRPVTAAALTSAAAGVMAGGVFGSWAARSLAAAAALVGVAWAVVALRSKRTALVQGLAIPLCGGLAILTVVPDQGQIARLMREAVTNGHLLRPPVPFDPGWRPILLVVCFMLGFAAAWVGAALQRSQIALLPPLLVLGFTAISQPAEGEVLAGVLAFVPLLLALAVLYGGDTRSASELTSQFELRRALRGALFLIPAVILLVAVGKSSFLFPKPAYNPANKPQKPRSIPLSKVEDKVLFEVQSDNFTGPWRTGVLDTFDGRTWRLPPFDDSRYTPVGSDGIVNATKPGSVSVKFVVRNLQASPTFPGLAAPTRIRVETPGVAVMYDPRTDTFRVPTGRVNPGTVYEMRTDPYPSGDVFRRAQPAKPDLPELLEIPRPPPAVSELLSKAPANPWERLDFLRAQLLKVAVAVGAGQPKDVPVAKVQQILAGNHEASPFEIVAAEAMLARWAGIPSRIGFGFDGFNDEEGVKTVRPKNGSSWLEVEFAGLGWQPLIATPQQAKSTLDSDPNAKFDLNVQPSEDVAVELYVPIELENIQLLYERVRHRVAQATPWVLLALAGYLAWPAALRSIRRSRRRRWSAALGPRAQIAVEYAELRDLAMDLNVGDPYDTPLEYLDRVQPDDEHTELAWLVTRALYGDLAQTVTDRDAAAAEEMATSLRRRMFRGQQVQSRLLALVGRASLKYPYTAEVPNAPLLRLSMPRRSAARGRRAGGGRRALRRALTLGRA
jgi:hypothetical protein